MLFLLLLPCLSKADWDLQSNPQPDTLSKSGQNDFWHLFKEDSLWSFRSKKGYVPLLLYNLKMQATSPLRMTKKDFYVILGAAGITAVLFHYDEDIDNYFRPLKEKHAWLASTSPYVTELGDYYGYSFLALSGVFSLVSQNHKLLHTTLLASQSMLCAGLWARVGKVLTGRMRPGATYGDAEYHSDHWFGPFAQFNTVERGIRGIGSYDAFPSGHTAAAFSIATVFAGMYSDRPAVPVIAYALATTVAITRMVEHEHWASDLIPGALIGYGCGRLIVKNYKKTFPQYKNADYHRKKGKTSLTLYPMTKVPGLQCRLVF